MNEFHRPAVKRSAGIRVGLLAPMIAAALSLAITDRAEACSSQQACAFEHAGYGGNQRGLTDTGDWLNLTGDLNDKTSSARNNKWAGGPGFRMAEHAGGGGFVICVPGSTVLYTLNGSGYNDQISALRLTGSC